METSSDPGRRSCGCRTGAEHQAAIAAIREARVATDKETNRVKSIEEYAIDLVVEGAESVAEDDLNEDGEIAEDDHQAACDLAIDIAHAIRDNPQVVLELVAAVKGGPDA